MTAARTSRPKDDGGGPASVAAIAAELRRDIVMLRLAPGERLSENALAARFGTSRTPVREALIRLAREDIIEVLPQRGTFVSRISLKAVKRARFVREALEIAIVRRAAEIGIAPAVRVRIDAAIARQRAARDDAIAFTLADDAFHAALASGIGLPDVWNVVEREKSQFDRLRFLSLPSITPIDTLIAQHEAILAAVLSRDVARAEAEMRTHLSEVLKITDRLAATRPDLILADDEEDAPFPPPQPQGSAS